MSETPAAGQPNLFTPVTVLWIVLVGVFAFSAFIALSAYAPDLEQHNGDCRPTVYSRCAIGYAALAEVMKQNGETVLISRAPMTNRGPETLLIAAPEPELDRKITPLAGHQGVMLVILPKWEMAPDGLHRGWGKKMGLLAPKILPHKDLLEGLTLARRVGVSRAVLTGADATPAEGLTLTPGPIEALQTIAGKDWVPVLTDDKGRMILARAASKPIYVLSDPDLLNTQGLANADTFASAVTLVRMLRGGDGAVIFDVTLNGVQTGRSILRWMFDPPFLAVTLCLVAALVLVGVQAAFRFGPVRREVRVIALGKEALADNSAELIRLARKEQAMAPRYVTLIRAAVAKALGVPRDLTGDALTAFLDRLGQQRGAQDTLAGLAGQADRARDRARLTEIAQRLFRWKLEMTRERH